MDMKIINVFDAAIEGNFAEFQKLYTGDINIINEYTKLNLLCTTLCYTKNENDRIKIVDFLIKNKININFMEKKYKRNALHEVFINFYHGDSKYLYNVVKMLIDSGININATDKYNAIPLKYAITVCKLKTDELKDVYRLMLATGADYNLKDEFEKSCLVYAQELNWRNDFISIVEEFENENK